MSLVIRMERSGKKWRKGLMGWDCAELRIHAEVERGDNESTKTGTIMTAAGGSCCGGAT